MDDRMRTRLAIGVFVLAVLSYGLSLAFALLTHSDLILGEGLFPLSLLFYVGIGAFIVARSPNPIGWIFCAMGLSWQLRELGITVAANAVWTIPVLFQSLLLPISLSINLWGVTFGLVPLLFVLFPDGRTRSRGDKIVMLLAGLAMLTGLLTADPSFAIGSSKVPVPVPGTLLGLPLTPDLEDGLQGVVGTLFMVLYIYAAGSLAVRLYHSRGVQREQFKWLAYAGFFFAAVVVLIFLPEYVDSLQWLLGDAPYPALMLWGIPFALALLAVPAATGIAVFKYRLYDIDVIIRRTLIYSTLTVLLAFVYFASVVLLQQFFRLASGESSDVAIVVSTLAIAALFVPLRGRVQVLIDRRFYRSKYDSGQVLAAFGATVRDEVDLNRLQEELLAIIKQTVQPEHVSLWLKDRAGRHGPESGQRGASTREFESEKMGATRVP